MALSFYRSIKVVQAGLIVQVHATGCVVLQDDGRTSFRRYAPEMTARYVPVVGDFWVVYSDDGYESISPSKAFINGYVLRE